MRRVSDRHTRLQTTLTCSCSRGNNDQRSHHIQSSHLSQCQHCRTDPDWSHLYHTGPTEEANWQIKPRLTQPECYDQGDYSPGDVKFPDGSQYSSVALGMLSVTHIMPILVLNTCMDTNMQLTINSFRELFPDKIFSPIFSWLLVKYVTFPWQLSNSLTFPGFPDKWSACVKKVKQRTRSAATVRRLQREVNMFLRVQAHDKWRDVDNLLAHSAKKSFNPVSEQ